MTLFLNNDLEIKGMALQILNKRIKIFMKRLKR